MITTMMMNFAGKNEGLVMFYIVKDHNLEIVEKFGTEVEAEKYWIEVLGGNYEIMSESQLRNELEAVEAYRNNSSRTTRTVNRISHVARRSYQNTCNK